MKTAANRRKTTWIITAIFGILFFFLLAFRLDLFREKTLKFQPIEALTSEKESWMNIFQNGQKIGYARRSITPHPNGYHLFESTRMRINTMGMVQDIHFSITGALQPDFTIASFTFDMQSSLFHFKVNGKREGDILRIFSENQETQIPVSEGILLASGALEAALDSIAQPNQTLTFSVFDPLTMNKHPVRITMKGYETLQIMGHDQTARKVSIELMGVSQMAWIGEDGSILQEDGLLGIRLQQATKENALEDEWLTSSQDLTEMVSVPSNVVLKSPNELNRIKLKITGIPDTMDLNGGRQLYEAPILTIDRETLPTTFESTEIIDRRFMVSTPFIQSDHPNMRHQVSEIVAPTDSPLTKASKIMDWIYTHIEKRPVLSVPNALETLNHRMGDCNEHAVLFAAMLRTAGIPVQIETGLLYSKGRFYYHAWNSLYLGKWITADALMGQMPTDVTHICILRGDIEQQVDLIGIIGKIELEILEPTS